MLFGRTEAMAAQVQIGLHGAVETDDDTVHVGHCIVQWTGTPHCLQEDTTLDTFEPPMHLKKGELVCEARFLNAMTCGDHWHGEPSEELHTLVRMQHVVATDLVLEPVSESNPFPLGARKRLDVAALRPVKLSEEDHERIANEMFFRKELGHSEEWDPEEESEGESESDDDLSSGSGSESDSDDE